MAATQNPQLLDYVTKTLGVDPLKQEKGDDILQKVMEKLKKQRAEEAEKKVEGWMTEVIKLVQEQDNLVKQFNKAQQQSDNKIRCFVLRKVRNIFLC